MSFPRFLAACNHFANHHFSGIPVVKISPESERTKDAIAKARKVVEEDQKDDAAEEVGSEKKNGQDPTVETSQKMEESGKVDAEASTTSKKREREEDAEVSEAKKSKLDAVV